MYILLFAAYICARLKKGLNEYKNKTPYDILFQLMEMLCGPVFTYNTVSIKTMSLFSPCKWLLFIYLFKERTVVLSIVNI